MSEVAIPPISIFLINREQTKPTKYLAEGYTWYNELTCQPGNLPSSHCPNVTGGEDQIDHIASARNFGWQSGVEDLAPDYEFAVEGSSTSLLHQSRPVTVFDAKGVHTKGTMKLSVKSCEFQQKHKPRLHHNCFSLF